MKTEEERKSLTVWATCAHTVDARYCAYCMEKLKKALHAEGRRAVLDEQMVDSTAMYPQSYVLKMLEASKAVDVAEGRRAGLEEAVVAWRKCGNLDNVPDKIRACMEPRT